MEYFANMLFIIIFWSCVFWGVTYFILEILPEYLDLFRHKKE